MSTQADAPAKPRLCLAHIRQRCLDCSELRVDVKRCAATDCPLHPYRLGHRPKENAPGIRKAVREHCLWCCGGDQMAPSGCVSFDCPLWPFRRSTQGSERVPHKEVQEHIVAQARRDALKGCQKPILPHERPTPPRFTGYDPRPMVTAASAASRRCPHWYGGWCALEALSDNPKLRPNCKLQNGSNTKEWDECSTCIEQPRKYGRDGCAACVVFHADPCAFFESAVLPNCPDTTKEDYALRTAPLSALGMSEKCRFLKAKQGHVVKKDPEVAPEDVEAE